MATDATRRLHHATRSWVKGGAVFHVRLRVERANKQPLTEPHSADALLKSAAFYHERDSWHCHLLLLMPDHLHALLSFPSDSQMTIVVGRWKAWQKRTLGIAWQDNFFGHRIRNDRELELKAAYIRQNPVVKGLCEQLDKWPRVFVANSFNLE